MKTEQVCVETPATLREPKDLLQKPGRAEEDAAEKQDEIKYVDVELVHFNTVRGTTEEDCRFGGRNQNPFLINGSGVPTLRATEPKLTIKHINETKKDDPGRGECMEGVEEIPSDPLDHQSHNAETGDYIISGDGRERTITQPELSKREVHAARSGKLHGSDNDLSGGSESDDYEEDEDVCLVLSDDCVPCVTDDESHYITTHEIQLSELSDREEDYDLGLGSSTSWDMEDDNQVYSFVDYASLAGGGAVGERGGGGAAAVSTLLESDPSDAAKFISSEESESKPQQQQQDGAGQIHLSIRATSRAINDSGSIQEQGNDLYHARSSGDMSRYVFRGVDGKVETLCEGAKCFIAAPGRLHFGRKLRGKEITEFSSGESSAVSELDDADKEVRSLTAKAFKSLAYPYFDAINFSTSSESSTSDGQGINRWATFVDLKYGNVNVSQGLDQRVVSHQNSFEIAKNLENRGYKGIALSSIKPPTSKIFTLSGNPHSASSSKQIDLMGEFSQGHSEVIRLTETFNFRCNVKSGMSAGERQTQFAQNAAGSRSTDEVTNSLQSGQRRGASKSPSKTMEDTHKKAIFASSLIKNVISKKMQFEQERKMERGEISEAAAVCAGHQELDRDRASRELHRQTSRFSESSSDYAIMCVDELGDIVDSGSCDSRRPDMAAPAPETNFELANEAGIDTKKGALDASRSSTLLRSQNSAFRCWKDEELKFQRDHKNDQTLEKSSSADDREAEGDQHSVGSGKPTKMSHLFVPSIQLLPSDGDAGQQLQNSNDSPCGDGREIQLRSDTLFFADSRSVATSKSPEIKINLRSIRDNKTEPSGISKLRAPNIGCNSASQIRTDDLKCQALAAALKGESSDKVPHFMVRDIRDNKGKLQTPIHQVRDVRKLVKSSYHFVSLDNNENKCPFSSAESNTEQKKQMSYRNPHSVSPIVIKCQSVNTNSNGKASGALTDLSVQDMARSSPEGAKSTPQQTAAGRAAIGNSNITTDGVTGLSIESKTTSKKQEKISDITDKSKMANQGALEKLQAAVKTMEQLYVFEKNEWKRKNEPHLLTDSHVLSLIASEEHGGPEDEAGRASNMDRTVRRDSYPNNDKMSPALGSSPSTDSLLRREDKDIPEVFQTNSSLEERLVARSQKKNMFSLSSSLKASTAPKTAQPNAIPQTPFSTKSFVPKSPKLPVSSKVSQAKLGGNEGAEYKEGETSTQEIFSASADNENYLTIPVKSHASSNKQASSAERTSVFTFTTQTQPHYSSGHVGSGPRVLEDHNRSPKRSSIVMDSRSPETPPATIYHSLPVGMSPNQPQVYCFSPAITPAPTLDPFQATQRKMLLDPTTGNYYLVDTPVQPVTKRLFDPETGQFVDVPMPQPPMTPVPMPISPYGHTYMIYPGFMPTPSLIPARTLVQSQMSVQSEVDSGEKALSQQTEGMYMDSPFYMSTGKSPQATYGAQQQAVTSRPPQGFSSIKQPLISITSQQGPRIIAPPSFDGTTMSFVVEHR